MLKPKSNEKPKKQIGYLKRAREMQELAHANFEPERGEHMACDLTPIGHWLPLPSEYRYARRASRDELRDFFYLLGCDDTLAQATR